MPFTMDDFHDLIRLIETRPEWRAELRRLVLTEELLAAPDQLAALRALWQESIYSPKPPNWLAGLRSGKAPMDVPSLRPPLPPHPDFISSSPVEQQ